MKKMVGRAARQSLIILVSYCVITVIAANINSSWFIFPTGKSYLHNISMTFLLALPNVMTY